MRMAVETSSETQVNKKKGWGSVCMASGLRKGNS
jgi:hypothetical protein